MVIHWKCNSLAISTALTKIMLPFTKKCQCHWQNGIAAVSLWRYSYTDVFVVTCVCVYQYCLHFLVFNFIRNVMQRIHNKLNGVEYHWFRSSVPCVIGCYPQYSPTHMQSNHIAKAIQYVYICNSAIHFKQSWDHGFCSSIVLIY